MKTNNVGGGSKSVKHDRGGDWTTYGGNKPPVSRVPLMPKYGHKSFIFRLKKWLTD